VDGQHEQRQVFCGIDWAERHHDVALVDVEGRSLAKQRIGDDADGFAQLLALLAKHGAAPGPDGTPVAIETAAGLLPAAVVAAGYRLFPINPLAVSRYRDRYGAAKTKSDAGDAFVLANIARTDLPAHRPLPADSELVQAIRVLARAHADAVGDRQQTQNKLRSLLREYYPAALATLPDLSTITARTTLRLAPTPQAARSLTPGQLRAALVAAGRHTHLATEVPRIITGLHAAQLRQLPQVEHAMGQQALALLGMLDAASGAVTGAGTGRDVRRARRRTDPAQPARPGHGPGRTPARRARRRPDPVQLRPRATSVRRDRPHHPGVRDVCVACSHAASATDASRRCPTSGPSACSPPPPAPAPTTTSDANGATDTAPQDVGWPADT
jgi:transposase